eukprot:4611511-Pleurochrysis_carterae.AAC.1
MAVGQRVVQGRANTWSMYWCHGREEGGTDGFTSCRKSGSFTDVGSNGGAASSAASARFRRCASAYFCEACWRMRQRAVAASAVSRRQWWPRSLRVCTYACKTSDCRSGERAILPASRCETSFAHPTLASASCSRILASTSLCVGGLSKNCERRMFS